MMIRYEIAEIHLKKSIFRIDGYFDALATWKRLKAQHGVFTVFPFCEEGKMDVAGLAL